jgi:hypothetical protein
MTTATPSSSFTRPSDTTAYTSGDLVANSTTAGSVTPMSWVITANSHGNVLIRRCRIQKSTNSTTNASFRLHLYLTSPTPTNGDNGAWLTTVSGYLGSLDVTIAKAFSDGGGAALEAGVPTTGSEIIVAGGTDLTIYGLLEARGAYTPSSAEVFTTTLEVYTNGSY